MLVGAPGVEPGPGTLKGCCAAITPYSHCVLVGTVRFELTSPRVRAEYNSRYTTCPESIKLLKSVLQNKRSSFSTRPSVCSCLLGVTYAYPSPSMSAAESPAVRLLIIATAVVFVITVAFLVANILVKSK